MHLVTILYNHFMYYDLLEDHDYIHFLDLVVEIVALCECNYETHVNSIEN